jgi:hypothetical protein
MAKLMLIGKAAHIEIKNGQDDGDDGTCVIAQCNTHAGDPYCIWQGRYDDLNDAAEYAQDHADRGAW